MLPLTWIEWRLGELETALAAIDQIVISGPANHPPTLLARPPMYVSKNCLHIFWTIVQPFTSALEFRLCLQAKKPLPDTCATGPLRETGASSVDHILVLLHYDYCIPCLRLQRPWPTEPLVER